MRLLNLLNNEKLVENQKIWLQMEKFVLTKFQGIL